MIDSSRYEVSCGLAIRLQGEVSLVALCQTDEAPIGEANNADDASSDVAASNEESENTSSAGSSKPVSGDGYAVTVEVDKEALGGTEKGQDIDPGMAEGLGLFSDTDRSD